MVKAYKDTVQSLKSCGAISAATQLEGEMRTEQRRQRNLQNGNPSVAAAFQYQRDLETLAHIKETQRVREANSVTKALADTKSNLQEANRHLRKRKAELLNAESLLEAQHSINNFSLDTLGQGKARSGGHAARKARWQVLDRFARLGSGLSPSQTNDFVWFKETWDVKMACEHGENWGGTFAAWLQKVLDGLRDGVFDAFSLFVYNETRRCILIVPMLSVPG